MTAPPTMSPYEQAALAAVQRWHAQRARSAGRRRPRPGAALARRAQRLPGAGGLESGLLRSVQGMHGLVTDAAVASLSERQVRRAYRRQGVELERLDDIRRLDLEVVDAALPTLGTRYAVALAGEGAVSGALAGGGATMLVAGGAAGVGVGALPGATVTGGLLAADLAAVLGGATRAVGHHAAYHGYDPRQPWERPFVLGVMAAAAADDQRAKVVALTELRRLAAALAVRGTAEHLGHDALVRLLRRMLGAVGERLTQRKLATIVPVAGAAIGGGLNYAYVRDVADCARWLYRERFLVDKHGLHDPVDAPAAIEAVAAGRSERPQVPPPPRALPPVA